MVPLESSKVFCHLSPADLEKVRKVAQERSFSRHQIIFKEGDPGDGVYVVKDGHVALTKVMADGEARPLAQAGEGDVFGDMAALEDGPRAMGAVAGGEAAVYYIARRNLLELMEQMPQLAAGMAREAGRHNRDFNEQCTREALEGERLSLVGRFASSIAHDLKNPLNIIGISADMACMASATAESREVSRARIRQQVERISNMVSELLEFAQGSGADYIAARMDYGAFVRRLMDEIEPEFALKSVKVECVNEPPAALVRANPQRLARVFRNFIGNAADAMPEGGAVRLSFRVNSDPSVVTELHDTGRGIPPQMLDHLFEAFATCGKANGAGLGLSVCRKIIQDHQGTVYARNAPEGGAVFGFTLPICKT